MPTFVPTSKAGLVSALALDLAANPNRTRVGLDGAPSTEPESWAADLALALNSLGRPVAQIRAEMFWRDASLRLEYGREDVEAYLGWLDAAALRREVLDPIVADGWYLPSLRDPRTNRATRAPAEQLGEGGVLIVSGAFLFGLGLPFDRAVHLSASAAAIARRTSPDQTWTLPAFARYETAVAPQEVADVVVRLEDPRHPAVRGLTVDK